MTQLLKRSGARGTGSENNRLFFSARIRLTVLYTVIFGTILITLSIILYSLFAGDIHEDMSSVYPPGSEQERIINYHKGILKQVIVGTDAALLVFIFFAGYALAAATLKPIQDNFETQRRFLADASHELRTPVTILKTDLEVSLADRTPSRNVRKTFRTYLDVVNQMQVMVEDLLTLARFDSKQVELRRERIPVTPFVKRAVMLLSPLARKKNIRFQFRSDTTAHISGDSHLLIRAVTNILKNAIEYSPERSSISVTASESADAVRLTVRDTGIGIRPEDLPHIFDRFYRSDASRSMRRDGTGLGLSISKQIVALHFGSIDANNVFPKGSEFTIALPKVGNHINKA